ncbi:stabilizer of axonemal microtubules 1 [Teleopsis dalmanni]|uniref:stabilizer of axonemal microtubules 1 n=1 Tax=Teleopsis dalmanni TaxID=139649 RepID=UPI0018CEADE5|nr:stabilizer of axonemal microtubules 1 [Teleopsis dalmanni]
MCDQGLCDIPGDCLANAPTNCGLDAGMSCPTGCQLPCDPCSLPPQYVPCSPGAQCNLPCDCGDYSSCCYQQPPRTLPIRPVATIMRSTAPLETETIYKRSYYGNCGDCFRAKPVLPCHNLQPNKAPMERCTVQKLSYMPPCAYMRSAPIRPKDNGMRFNGPLYAMTSQKHDYVAKCYSKRDPIRPRGNGWKVCAPLESCTINRLSYMPNDVCRNPPPQPIKQPNNFNPFTGAVENCTVQKLSYMPVCIPPKDPMPWADKIRCIPPKYENLCTTYNLSYMPNCNPSRMAPIRPLPGLKCLGNDSGDCNTVYKLSYMPVGGCRPTPILPIPALQLPTGKMEQCTVQKLSYQPNYCLGRVQPIRPRENCIKPSGPIFGITTQKHDFGPKPLCRRTPIRPRSLICRSTGGMEKCTINRLSYMPVCDFTRPLPIKPIPGVVSNKEPPEKCTTYKLSYMPNCVLPKDPMPWAEKAPYIKPCIPMEKCTIQKLSYGPPGTFSRCGGVCPQSDSSPCYPKAAIC